MMLMVKIVLTAKEWGDRATDKTFTPQELQDQVRREGWIIRNNIIYPTVSRRQWPGRQEPLSDRLIDYSNPIGRIEKA